MQQEKRKALPNAKEEVLCSECVFQLDILPIAFFNPPLIFFLHFLSLPTSFAFPSLRF
jgi:hypothetical protein